MSWDTLKDLLLSLTALGGVVVTGISVYRISTGSFQETLHARQVDMCVDIITQLDIFAVEFYSLLTCARGPYDKDSLSHTLLDVQSNLFGLRHKLKGYSLLLPTATLQQLLAYLTVLESIVFGPDDMERRVRRFHDTASPVAETVVARLAAAQLDVVSAAYASFLVVARTSLGIDALSKKTYELLRS